MEDRGCFGPREAHWWLIQTDCSRAVRIAQCLKSTVSCYENHGLPSRKNWNWITPRHRKCLERQGRIGNPLPAKWGYHTRCKCGFRHDPCANEGVWWKRDCKPGKTKRKELSIFVAWLCNIAAWELYLTR